MHELRNRKCLYQRSVRSITLHVTTFYILPGFCRVNSQNSKQKHRTKNFVRFPNHFPLKSSISFTTLSLTYRQTTPHKQNLDMMQLKYLKVSESRTLKALWKGLQNAKLSPFSPTFLAFKSRFPVSLDIFRKKRAIQTLPAFEGFTCNLLIIFQFWQDASKSTIRDLCNVMVCMHCT